MKHRMLLVLTLSVSLAGLAVAAEPPVISATPAPATKPAKKGAATKEKTASKASGDEVITLSPPETAVVSQKAVVVRGQARLNSEIVTRLQRGDKITVLEEIKTKKRADEPERWYKIALPTGAGVWVDSSFLDAEKKVKPNRLNVRTGPGENYSVIARLDKGTEVKILDTKGGWSKIEAPGSAYAYVAAHLVTREPAAAVAAATPTTPVAPITPVAVPATPVVAPPPVTPPVSSPVVANPVVPVVQPKPVLIPLPSEEPLARRIVTREGIVRGSVSVQAPTHFVLRSLDNKRTINYLYSTNASISVGQYRGLRVMVTGEEALDERWPNTPVIELETLTPLE